MSGAQRKRTIVQFGEDSGAVMERRLHITKVSSSNLVMRFAFGIFSLKRPEYWLCLQEADIECD